ncbi:Putative Oligopeptide transporter [[Torrubiella] hemipterigena]|uniref:Putative Oligopeptide transporter n=1 Tax=[Torrubiella] hemipterigena TaxID=1531966 RepID=A0A0A1TDU0_9HYPO|nr:Putative Oligopeptide transporter [[Torrubiella] hemipterigena]
MGADAAISSGHEAYNPDGQVVEKRGPGVDDYETKSISSQEDEAITDLFTSFPPIKGAAPELNPLTFRAVFVGVVLGSLVNASNVYLGLKTGFTFSATLFGAIFGYGVITLLCKALPNTPVLGMPFGPQENSIIQAAASGAGGIAGPFVAGFPAMYRLGVMTISADGQTTLPQQPKSDYGRIVSITVICALFGLFAAIPLRKFFIINVARELNLVFPTPTATALSIRSMHAAGTGAAEAAKKIKALCAAFAGAITIIVAGSYADGILHNWHPFTWFYLWGGRKNRTLMAIESWGWYIQLTPAFFGSGLLVGMNAALSWWGGTFVAWAIIGPVLVYYGECKGNGGDDEGWEGLVDYNSLKNLAKPGYVASPRFWMLWPGVVVLIVYSLVEFVMHINIVWDGLVYAFRSICASIQARSKSPNSDSFIARQAAKINNDSSLVEDFATKDQQVPGWLWSIGALVMVVVAMLVCHFEFGMNPGLAVLACVLAIIFAFLSIHGGAVTDNTPLTASSKASQLVFGGVTKNSGHTILEAQQINLIAGNLASGCANVATDLVSDFRVGFLLKTPPKLQFYAQAVGTIVAIFLAPAIFVLFMAAYPCVWDQAVIEEFSNTHQKCAFAAPSVAAWAAVAQAVTLPSIPIPHSCVIFTIVMGVACALQAVVKNLWLTGPREKYRNYLPNWMSIGVAWVIGTDSGYANAVMAGAVVAHFWRRWNNAHFDLYGYAVAAGLLAGEGLGGVINAALTLGGVSGDKKGTKIALPGETW